MQCTDMHPVARVKCVWQEEVEFEAQDVVCSVCEEAWAAERLEEHSELCAVLLQVGGGCWRMLRVGTAA